MTEIKNDNNENIEFYDLASDEEIATTIKLYSKALDTFLLLKENGFIDEILTCRNLLLYQGTKQAAKQIKDYENILKNLCDLGFLDKPLMLFSDIGGLDDNGPSEIPIYKGF
jgi:hypothetical protein